MARFDRCVVHIGVEKTGTTSIQEWLARNRDTLAAGGFFVPRAPGKFHHERLAAYAQDDGKADDTRARALTGYGGDLAAFRVGLEHDLHAEAAAAPANVRTLIVSSEHLHSRLTTVEEKRRLKALLQPLAARIEVLVYLRRQDRLSLSAFSTWAKTGARNYATPLTIRGRHTPYYFDFARILREYEAAFGREFITVRIYEPERLRNGDVVADFRETVGIPHDDSFLETSPRNESLPAGGQRLLVAVNALLHEAGAVTHTGSPMHHGVRDLIVEAAEHVEGATPRTAPLDQAQAFLDRFSEGNEAIRQAYFPDAPSLFSSDMSMYPEKVRHFVELEDALKISAKALIRQQALIQELREWIAEKKPPAQAAGDKNGGSKHGARRR